MPALTFDDFDAMTGGGGQNAPAAKASSRALTFDDFDRMTAAPKPELNAEGRVGGAITSGLISGLTGIAGLPADLLRLGQAGLDYSQSIGQGRPYADISRENEEKGVNPISDKTLEALGGAGIKRALMDRLPEALDYKPQNGGERAVETVASFLGGGAPFGALRSAGSLGAQVALPAAASLGAGAAAGVAGVGPTGQAIAEGAGAILGGGAGLVAQARRAPSNAILRDKVRGMDPAALEQAQALMDEGMALRHPVTGEATPVRIPVDQAYAQVTGQTNNPLTTARTVVERTPEGAAVYAPIVAETPGQVQRAGEAMLAGVSPTLRAPGAIGTDVQIAARSALNAGPEGRRMAQAMQQAGPRISPMQAGDIIQPELRGVYDRRMQARADADAVNYPAAEAAPERIGVDRYLLGERPGDPIITPQEYSRPQFTGDAPAPLEKPSKGVAAERAGPDSLSRFIAKNGGIASDSDLVANDFHRFNVPGVGTVAREGGKPLDSFWRPKLIEAGYLPEDPGGGSARDIRGELMRKLRNEQVGVPTYPAGSEREIAAIQAERNRSGQMADDYNYGLDLAKSRYHEDLTNAGVDPGSVHPDIQSRVLGATMRDPNLSPLDAHEAVVNATLANPKPLVKSTTVEEPIYAPRFGQANPQSALDYIDNQLARGAKGPIADALEGARALLMERGTGQTDFSIAGLSEARKSINAMLSDAPKQVQERLLAVRNRLDADLSVAPEYEVARGTHEQLSRPLDPFDPSRPAGRAVEQDPLTSRFNVPPEQVPDTFMAPSAARDFQGLATPSARAAQERHVTTQLLNGVSDGRGDINPDALLRSIRDNHDTLTAFPEVRQRLINVATARDGLARAEQSTILGRVSQEPDVKRALSQIFDPNPLPETRAEITRTVNGLHERNPRATAELLRLQMETMLNTARHTAIPGEGPKAGAKWSVALRGHPVQRENLEAFMRGLPNGEQRLAGFNRAMEIMEATGKAPAPQSGTAFFSRDLKDMSASSIVRELPTAVKTGGFSLVKRFNEFQERVSLGRNLDQIANILTREDSGRVLAQLARTPARASRAQILALRLSYMGRQGSTQQD